AYALQLALDMADQVDELRSHVQHRRFAVAHDEGDLGAREPPVHGRHHHAGLHGAHQQLEIDVAVLAEIGDALAASHTHRDQRVGDAIRLDVELGEAGDTTFELEGDGIAAALGAL